MNYVCTTAIILAILLLIYLIRQPKTLFEGISTMDSSSDSAAAECYANRYDDLHKAYCSGPSGCNTTSLQNHFEKHGRAEGRLYGCIKTNSDTEEKSETDDNSSSESNSSESNSSGTASNDNMHDDSNNNYQKINQNYTFNITIPNNKPKDYFPPPQPVSQPNETYNDLIRPTMSSEAFSLPFNKC